jgi:maltose alpha-D-glucosyltransferase/alpha-amylase
VIEPTFCTSLIDLVASRVRTWGSAGGELTSTPLPTFADLRHQEGVAVGGASGGQQNTSLICDGGRFALKMLPRLEEGIHPAWDIGRLLSDQQFSHAAPLAGGLEYRRRRGLPAQFAVIHGYVRNEGDAWHLTLDALGDFVERVVTQGDINGPPPETPTSEWADEPPDAIETLIGDYINQAHLLGRRTAELHLALAADNSPEFAPEGFNALFQRSVYQAMRSQKMDVFYELRRRLGELPEETRALAEQALAQDAEIMRRFRLLVDRRMQSSRIRCHGNYHLAQIVFTGKDFVIVDFEGPSRKSLPERRLKHSPAKDLASMLQSFHYALLTTLHRQGGTTPQAAIRDEDRPKLEPWARFWYRWVRAGFLKGYLDLAGSAPFVPQSQEERQILFDAYMLERGLRSLAHELQHRPAWTNIPLTAILDTLHVIEPIHAYLPVGAT